MGKKLQRIEGLSKHEDTQPLVIINICCLIHQSLKTQEYAGDRLVSTQIAIGNKQKKRQFTNYSSDLI